MRKSGIELLDSLARIKGNGSFVTSNSAPFVFPGLTVHGLGEIAYPINQMQAKALIQVAHKAPFGKGLQTIVDDTVRSAWEIDAEKLHFNGLEWDKLLTKTLAYIKPQLGIEDYEIEAHLYKMLIYEKGDFFLSHRDSEKEKGMFGTLIMGLPSKHVGGELLVRFDGEEKSIQFAESASNNNIPYVAFYADCEHEVKPLTDGVRVCLVYNLVQKENHKAIRLEPIGGHVSELAAILKRGIANGEFSPGIVLLGHQYTPENFSRAHLKLNDRTRAEALLRAADAAGYYAKMCLVTSYLSGMPTGGGYGWEEDDLEDADIEEVFDESLYIEHWLNDGTPPLRNIQVEEDNLLATFSINEGEPIFKESEGYMGNYGPDLMHWYHYGAVVFWPKNDHAAMLLTQDTATQLEWVGYYNARRTQLSDIETNLCETVLNGIQNLETRLPTINYDVIAEWLLGYNNEACFDKIGYQLLQRYFEKIKPELWVKLVDTYPAKHFEKIFRQVSVEGNRSGLLHLLSILRALSNTISRQELLSSQMSELPEYFSRLHATKQKPPLTAAGLDDLLDLENQLPQNEDWVNRMATILSNGDRDYVNNVLAPVILQRKKKSALTITLALFAKNELQKRAEDQPQPPADWKKPVPRGARYASQWQILAAFLQSPTEQVFDFRRNQQERNDMEAAIRSTKVDLRTETIKKGSPYTLRIIKTQAAYNEQLADWKEDVALLDKLRKTPGEK